MEYLEKLEPHTIHAFEKITKPRNKVPKACKTNKTDCLLENILASIESSRLHLVFVSHIDKAILWAHELLYWADRALNIVFLGEYKYTFAIIGVLVSM